MPKKVDDLNILIKFKDAGSVRVIEKVSNSIRHLESSVKNTKPDIVGLRTEIMNLSQKGTKNIATLNAQRSSLKALRDEAKIGSTTFKQLTADVAKLDKQLEKTQGRQKGRGGKALAATQMAGAAISGGIFGGPEGFLGALGGGIVGGVPGAFAGAAIGAQVGIARKALGGVAETVAEINSMKIALAGVSTSLEDYEKSFDSVIEISKEFLIPVDKSIGEFTRLKAAVVGAGGSTDETVDVFKGFAAAILATGGNAEKLSGALLAASQVFSKGKVQAEELRGQIGERLPGAFATFAQSIGVSSRELDDMLRKGEVSTENFVEFTRTLFARYEKTAETLGSAPEKAGQRLQLALSLATLEYGGFFQKVGAGFQDYITNLVNFAIKNKETFISVAASAAVFVQDIGRIFSKVFAAISNPFIFAFEKVKGGLRNLLDVFTGVLGLLERVGSFTPVKIIADTVGFKGFQGFQAEPGEPSREERITGLRERIQNALKPFTPTGFGDSLGDIDLGGLGGGGGSISGGGGGSTSKKIPATQRLVDLQKQLADRAATITKREEIGLRHAIARMKVLDGTLKGTDRQLALDKLRGEFNKQMRDLDEQEAAKAKAEEERQAQADARRQDRIEQARVLAGEITQEEYDRTRTLKEMRELLSEQSPLYQKIKDKLTEIATPLDNFKAGLQELIQESGNLAENLAVAGVNAISQLGDELANFVATGKADFRSLTVSILQDMARIAAQSAFTNALSGIMNIFGGGGGSTPSPTPLPGSMPTLAANGMAFAQNKIVPYAMGGVVTKPTLFQFANGGAGRLGIMGEAGAEAILPLKRGADGKLGVEAQGGGVGNIVVNVDAKGTTTEGNAPNANMLGKLIGNAVQAELVKQRRPGGILA